MKLNVIRPCIKQDSTYVLLIPSLSLLSLIAWKMWGCSKDLNEQIVLCVAQGYDDISPTCTMWKIVKMQYRKQQSMWQTTEEEKVHRSQGPFGGPLQQCNNLLCSCFL